MTEPSIICETERLLLRSTTLSDIPFLTTLNADTEVCRFRGGVKTAHQSRQKIEEAIEHQERHGFSGYTVVVKRTGEAIGRCGLMFKEIEGVPELELGYVLARFHWGQGYATEAAEAALEHGFRLGQRRIVAIIYPGNHASIRVAEKSRMRYERMIQWENEPARLYVASQNNARESRSSYR